MSSPGEIVSLATFTAHWQSLGNREIELVEEIDVKDDSGKEAKLMITKTRPGGWVITPGAVTLSFENYIPKEGIEYNWPFLAGTGERGTFTIGLVGSVSFQYPAVVVQKAVPGVKKDGAVFKVELLVLAEPRIINP